MIRDIKFAFQCMKYSSNRKLFTRMSILFVILGIIQFTMRRRFNYITGGMMLVVAPNMFSQMFQTINMSNLVSASPKKKDMGVRILTAINSLGVLIGYVLFTIAIAIVYGLKRCPAEDIGYLFVVMGFMDVIISIYMAVSYKYYIISSIIFFISFMGVYGLAGTIIDDALLKLHISIPVGFGIGLGLIIVSIFCFYGISKLLYRRPMDKLAMQTALKGEL